LEQQLSDASHEREVLHSQIGQRDKEIASLRRQQDHQLAEIGRMKLAKSQLKSDLESRQAGRPELLQQQSDLIEKLEAARTKTQSLRDQLELLERQGAEDKDRPTAL
jgi:chromosome segregation ATPase